MSQKTSMLHDDEVMPGELVKMDKDFVKTVLFLEAIDPGIVFGAVDVVCRTCGETSVHQCNADGSNTYECPLCGMMTEI